MDHLLSRRRIGVLAPAMLMVAVPMAALVIATGTWAAWVVGLLSAVAVGSGTWWALAGLRPTVRIPVSMVGVFASAGAIYLAFVQAWPAIGGTGGLIGEFAMWIFLGVPWVVLIGGSTVSTRIGRGPGAKPVWPWWLAAIVACGLAYPLVGWAATVLQADDMALLVVFFIPAYALALWLGPLLVVLVTGLANPGPGPGDAAAADGPEAPGPPTAEVPAP